MSDAMIITAPVEFSREARGRRRLEMQPQPSTARRCPPGRVPRLARLLALALRLEDQVRRGERRLHLPGGGPHQGRALSELPLRFPSCPSSFWRCVTIA